MGAGSNLLLGKAELISDSGSASGIIHSRNEKKIHKGNFSWNRDSLAACGEDHGEADCAPAVELHGGTEGHWQLMEDSILEQVKASRGCNPVGSPCCGERSPY